MQEILKVLVQTNAKLATALAEIKNNQGPTERVAELLAEIEQLNIKLGLLEKETTNKTKELLKLTDYNAKLEAQIRDLIQTNKYVDINNEVILYAAPISQVKDPIPQVKDPVITWERPIGMVWY